MAAVRTVTNAMITIMAPAPVRPLHTQSLMIIFTLALLCGGRVKYVDTVTWQALSPPPPPPTSPLCPLFRLRGFDWTPPLGSISAIALIIDPTWLPETVHQSKQQEAVLWLFLIKRWLTS